MEIVGTVRGIAGLALLAAAACATEAPAHFHILLPSVPSARRGDAVEVTCRWGHPFEHQLFDADRPRTWFVVTPEGRKIDLLPSMEPIGVTKAVGFRASFSPEIRGDFTCVLQCQPLWMAEDEEYLQDSVRVVVHVQAQKGWDGRTTMPMDLVPLTRPYGLTPGMVFQAQALTEGKPLSGALVEIERYNPIPPKTLPPEELITRTSKTDPNGVVTATLPESGWWCVTVRHLAGSKERGGKSYPLWRRATLWVHVDERRPAESK